MEEIIILNDIQVIKGKIVNKKKFPTKMCTFNELTHIKSICSYPPWPS